MSLLNFLNESQKVSRTTDDLSQFLSGNSDVDPERYLPIRPKYGISEWEVKKDPESYVRTYSFSHLREVIFFVNELYKYSFEINHSIKILINDMSVTVSTTTHDFGGITDQDKKITNMADEFYSDIQHFNK